MCGPDNTHYIALHLLIILCKNEKGSYQAMESIIPRKNLPDIDQLITQYYGLTPKYTIKEICSIINDHHKISVTQRQIKYKIRKLNLSRMSMDCMFLGRAI